MLISVLAIGNPPYKNDSIEILRDHFERNRQSYNFLEDTVIGTINSHPSWWN